MEKTADRDASGNVKYGDIGTFPGRRDQGVFQRDPQRNEASSISIPATPSGACQQIPVTQPSACSSGTAPGKPEWAVGLTGSSASGTSSSPMCLYRWPRRSARRLIPREHSGTVSWLPPVSLGTCED